MSRSLNVRTLTLASALILLTACRGRIAMDAVASTPTESLSPATTASTPATPENTTSDQDCLGTWESHAIAAPSSGKDDQPRYTLSQDQFDTFLRLMQLEALCIPHDWGAPFVNADWNSEAGTASSGRMLSLGFESHYPGAGWSDAALIYATYDFTAGTEYDVFATREDRDNVRLETMPRMLVIDGAQGFTRPFASLPMGLQWVWHTVVFPFENHYIAVVLRLGAFEPDEISEAIADFNDGKFPEEMRPDLERMDALVNSLRFSRKEDAHFSLHLVANLSDPRQVDLTQLDCIELQQSPLIEEEDIIHYDLGTHEMQLSDAAFSRVISLFSLPIDSDGLPFVVSVSGEPVYTGAFYSPASSISYAGVVILHPLSGRPNTITLSLGYPSTEAFIGEDPRADARIISALHGLTNG